MLRGRLPIFLCVRSFYAVPSISLSAILSVERFLQRIEICLHLHQRSILGAIRVNVPREYASIRLYTEFGYIGIVSVNIRAKTGGYGYWKTDASRRTTPSMCICARVRVDVVTSFVVVVFFPSV